MKFEWDSDKNALNIEKHRIRFEDVQTIFDGIVYELVSPQEHGEIRVMATGLLKHREITVIYTQRGDTRHIISARRARKNEREEYWKEVYKGN